MTMFGQRTAAPQAPHAPAPQRSRYSVPSSDTRGPMLGIGTYRVRVLGCVEGNNPGKHRDSYKVALRVEVAADGSETSVGACVSTVSLITSPGLAEIKRFAISAAGFGPTLEQRAHAGDVKKLIVEGEEAYDALDEKLGGHQGAILESSAGKTSTAPQLQGRLVDVIVARGKDVPNPQTGAPTGDYFRLYTWGAVPDSEQTPPAA